MTYARTATGAFTRGYNTTLTPVLTGYGVGNLLLAATGCIMNTGGTPPSTIGAWTRVGLTTHSSHTALYATIAATTSDAMPPFAWTDFCWAVAWAVSGNPASLTGIVDGTQDGQANQVANAGITNAGSFTPTGSNRYIVHVANKNKTAASNATVFSAANNFSIIGQSVGSATAPAGIVSEWIQSTPVLVDTSGCTGTVADATAQTTQGVKVAFIPGVASFAPYPSARKQTIHHTEYIFD